MDQGLPIAFENNAATWQNMPGMAAFYTGRQNQIAEDNIGMLQKAFEAEQAFKAQQRPVELQNLVKSGVLTEAQARHQDALTRASGLMSDKAEAVMPGEIAATNSKNSLESAQAQQAQSATKAIHMASWLQGPGKYAPPFMQAQKFMETYGIQDTPDGSKGRQIIADMPKLIPLLEMEAKKAWELSGTGQQTLTKEAGDTKRTGMMTASNEKIAAGHDATQKDIATSKATAKVAGFEDNLMKIKKASEKRTALIDMANRIKDDNPELAASYIARANEPSVVATAQAELAAAAQATVTQGAKGPVLGTRQEGVNLGAPSEAATQKHSLADVQKMYPGVPPEQLRKAYKEKFGVDLK